MARNEGAISNKNLTHQQRLKETPVKSILTFFYCFLTPAVSAITIVPFRLLKLANTHVFDEKM